MRSCPGPNEMWTFGAQRREHAQESGDALEAVPIATHMALVELQNRGTMKYFDSKNCDGRHKNRGIFLPVSLGATVISPDQ